ncbi:hypothetical protein [Streptomyces palmae]|uniref:Uncharacterized protein n=1 Tax=Streptomyces palmae TaxID=1701085 RepID=A0A4Z0GN68_9ACTN|nr:hypothetical protein [Streptomyces palmae]TGA98557.1 hypothetical protein E4099_22940 [Streptomyces palmae]
MTAGAITAEGAIHAAALGTLGIVLMTASGGGSSTDGPPSEGQADTPSQSGSRPKPDETKPVTEEQQHSFEQSQQHLNGLSKRKQADEVGRGFERDGQKYNPEAPLLKTGKHGVDWSEGPARAIKDGRPQGQFGSAADVQYAAERGAELGPNNTGFFRLPEGHNCVDIFRMARRAHRTVFSSRCTPMARRTLTR